MSEAAQGQLAQGTSWSHEANHARAGYGFAKRSMDIAVSVFLLPVLIGCVVVLAVLNPFLNRGPLFFVQQRMGRGCVPFSAFKFRSMRPAAEITRSAEDPLEADRITTLGHIIRKARIDELPQLLNVLRGEMSLIGPRPDYYDHACVYLETIPGYRDRHAVKPGISGLAQTEVGYVAGSRATRRKVKADLIYISRASMRLDMWIFWRTLLTVISRAGS